MGPFELFCAQMEQQQKEIPGNKHCFIEEVPSDEEKEQHLTTTTDGSNTKDEDEEEDPLDTTSVGDPVASHYDDYIPKSSGGNEYYSDESYDSDEEDEYEDEYLIKKIRISEELTRRAELMSIKDKHPLISAIMSGNVKVAEFLLHQRRFCPLKVMKEAMTLAAGYPDEDVALSFLEMIDAACKSCFGDTNQPFSKCFGCLNKPQ